MYLFFHEAIALISVEIPWIKKKYAFNRLFLMIGAMISDLFDKGLGMFLTNYPSRAYGHSPLCLLAIVGLIYLIIPNRAIANSLGLGLGIHLLLDMPYLPYLYPFVDYGFGTHENLVGDIWYILTHNPLILGTEICGIIILVGIVLNYRLILNLERIYTFLWRWPTIETQKKMPKP